MLCCGLDPHLSRLPCDLEHTPQGLLEFCQRIAEAVAPHVCTFKPQAAHFAAAGAEVELAALISWLQHRYPELPVILDAKRGDIGATAELYAREAFDRYGADAVTVNPFLGPETLRPYLARKDRGVIVLCRTSNPDSDWLQASGPGEPVYLRIARAAQDWNEHGNVALVTGATHPRELGRVREVAPTMPLLVPGVGTQGGDIAAVLARGCRADGAGLMVNVSRGIAQAAEQGDPGKPLPADAFAAAAEQAAQGYAAQLRPLVRD